MTHIIRFFAPAAVAFLLCLPVKSARACDEKSCPHHSEHAGKGHKHKKDCDCATGEGKGGKSAKCTEKSCPHHHSDADAAPAAGGPSKSDANEQKQSD